MSLLDWISKAIFGTDTKGIYKIGRALNDAVRPDPVIKPFGRKHAWRVGLEDPPACGFGCGQTRNATNADALCLGPTKR